MINKIALGTVQFGLKYGISNRAGKVSEKGAFEILTFAHEKGIRMLDTAYSYGDSEDVIGRFIRKSGMSFDIISKFPDLDSSSSLAVEKHCKESLERLGQKKLYGYLVHKFENLSRDKGLLDGLMYLKQKDLVGKIGMSLYKPEELRYLRNNNIRFDILQIPYNVCDRRFEPYLPDLKENGVEIHIRSVFLQGLFFLESGEVDRNFRAAKEKIGELRRISAEYKIPLHSLCLCFTLLNPFIDKVVVGVDSVEQLRQNIDSIAYVDKVKDLYNALESMEFTDEQVILPYNWKL